jgi:hypothetical protein
MINWTSEDYAEVRAEYKKLSKTAYKRFERFWDKFNYFVVFPGAFVSTIVAILFGQLRFLWLLPIFLIAYLMSSVYRWSSQQEEVIRAVGDHVFIKKVLVDDAVVVQGPALQLVLEDPESYPVAVQELREAVEAWKARQHPKSASSRLRRRYSGGWSG